MKINIKTSDVLRLLLCSIIILVIGNVIVQYLMLNYSSDDNNWIRTFFKAFDFNTEGNFPTYFSALILLCNALVLFIISRHETIKYSGLWTLLALVFAFLSCDEMLQIHEHLVKPMRILFNTSGYLYFAWVIPYSFFVIIIAIFSYKLIFIYLPKRTRNLIFLSGFIFLAGAIGMELFGAKHAEIFGENYRKDSLTYFVLYTIEETLEMFGSVLFFYALLDYISAEIKQIKISF